MKLKKLRVQNYKCFLDSGHLEIDEEMTCIVGANDSGKSTLVECLTGHPGSSSFRGLGHQAAGESVVELEVEVGPNDYQRLAGNQLHFPLPRGMDAAQAGSHANTWINQPHRLRVAFTGSSITGTYTNLAPEERDDRTVLMELKDGQIRSASTSVSNTPAQATMPSLLASSLRARVFIFKAERKVIGRCSLANQGQLSTDASNLPAALNWMQTRREPRFGKLQRHMSEVFPHLEGVDARTEGAEAEVYVWPVRKDTEREDLAVRLVDSGTGVGQTLGILTVVVASEPSTIVIDEPQSFLHPGAIRRLFDVLRCYPQHQYVVVTHSPAVIAAARPGAMGLVSRTQVGSTVRNLSAGQPAFRELLAEVGARLSDVFGVDAVMWVEGRTEANAFPVVIEALIGPIPSGVAILPVRSVDELTGADVDRIVDVYKKVASAGATLLPTANFIFDGEHRARLEKRGGHPFSCLPVHNFETFLLDAQAIALHMNALPGFASVEILPGQVNEWLMRNDGTGDGADGARLLKKLFAEFSQTTYDYRKTQDSVELTKLVVKTAPERFDRLVALLKPMLDNAATGLSKPSSS